MGAEGVAGRAVSCVALGVGGYKVGVKLTRLAAAAGLQAKINERRDVRGGDNNERTNSSWFRSGVALAV